MRNSSKLILAAGAIAALAVPSIASADVQRTQDTVTTPAPKTATFNATQPSGAGGNWVHHFNVTVNSDGTFTGTNVITGTDYGDVPTTVNETVSGQITDTDNNGVSEITVHGVRPSNIYTDAWSVANAPMDGVADRMDVGTVSNATANGVSWDLPITFTAPVYSGGTTTATTEYKNHGDYVSAQGGGKDAAQSSIGMPVQSQKNKK
jgi:hypothetical protein